MRKILWLCVLLFGQSLAYAQDQKDCSQALTLLDQLSSDKNWDEAARFLEMCRKRDPYDAAVYVNLARLAQEKSDSVAALAAYLRAWELNPSKIDPKVAEQIYKNLDIEVKDLTSLGSFGSGWSNRTRALLLSWFNLAYWQFLLTLTLLLLALGLALLFLRKSPLSKILLGTFIPFSLITILLSFLLFRAAPLGYGVLLNSQAGLSSPSDFGSELFELKAGSPVVILRIETVEGVDWVQIQNLDAQKAWLHREKILSYSEI